MWNFQKGLNDDSFSKGQSVVIKNPWGGHSTGNTDNEKESVSIWNTLMCLDVLELVFPLS